MPDASGRVLVVSPNWLGDAVMALPAVADLRRHYAGAHLAVASRRGLADVWRAVPGVDEVIPLAYDGRLRHTRAWLADAAALALGRFSTAVLLPNSFASAWIARRAAIPDRWGYRGDLRGRLLTRAVPRPRGALHQAAVYYQALVRALDVPVGPLRPSLSPPPAARAEAARLLAPAGLSEGAPFVALAPGAAYGKAKQWLPERFAELIERLQTDHLPSVIVGTPADREAAREIGRALAAAGAAVQPVDLIGRTSLASLMGVLAASRACVSNDSGAMHLAAALGVPVTSVFGPTNERATAPLPANGEAGDPRHVAVVRADVFCRPCMLRECPIDHRCMTGISAERVAAAMKRQVER